jgi:hypothetical protein
VSERRALTLFQAQGNGLVGAWKGSGQARGTHMLQSAEGWTSQDMKRKRASEGHSHPAESRGMDLSKHGKEASE